jgi:hypothetical protein
MEKSNSIHEAHRWENPPADMEASYWSFIITKPCNETLMPFLFREKTIFAVISTPERNEGIHGSSLERTPFSPKAKGNIFSPFQTTCQKRNISSPFSPGLWRNLNSSLKKRKQHTHTPCETLFGQTHEKEHILKNRQIHMTPMIDHFNTETKFSLASEQKINHPIIEKELSFKENRALDKSQSLAEKIDSMKVHTLPPKSKEISEVKATDKFHEEGCNCRNTGCLKLYCQCLRAGKMCINCNCSDCENGSHSKIRNEKLTTLRKKHPAIFDSQITSDRDSKKKSCNCKRSNCLKNYCDCHQNGSKCGEWCKCVECKNVLVVPSIERSDNKTSEAENQRIPAIARIF